MTSSAPSTSTNSIGLRIKQWLDRAGGGGGGGELTFFTISLPVSVTSKVAPTFSCFFFLLENTVQSTTSLTRNKLNAFGSPHLKPSRATTCATVLMSTVHVFLRENSRNLQHPMTTVIHLACRCKKECLPFVTQFLSVFNSTHSSRSG